MIKAFLCALILTFRELRTSPWTSQKQSNRNAPVGVLYATFLRLNSAFSGGDLTKGRLIYTSAWGFPLLVSTCRAMRRPSGRGTSDITAPRFLLCVFNKLTIWSSMEPDDIFIPSNMEKENKNEGLQSRRDFFKKAAKGVLPVLGAITLLGTPGIVKAVEGASDCSYSCSYGCSNTCRGTCSGGCSGACGGACSYSCQNTCKGSCQGRCSYGCSSMSRF